MFNLTTPKFFELLLSISRSIPILKSIGKPFINQIKKRNIRSFWKPFLNREEVIIILSEYNIKNIENQSSHQFTQTIKEATNGHLVSMGNAQAMANLLNFFSKNKKFRITPYVRGSETIIELEQRTNNTPSNLILLGSPISNKISREKIECFKQANIYNIPYEVKEKGQKIIICEISGGQKEYTPTINAEGDGLDYALIIKAKDPDDVNRYLIILAGANMYGVHAASKIITNPYKLKTINKKIKNNDCWILIETKIKKFFPSESKIKNLGIINSSIVP